MGAFKRAGMRAALLSPVGLRGCAPGGANPLARNAVDFHLNRAPELTDPPQLDLSALA